MFQKTIRIVAGICLAALTACYGLWLFRAPQLSVASVVASLVVCVLFAYIGVVCIKRVFFEWEGAPESNVHEILGRRSLRPGNFHPVLKLFLALLLSRILVYIVAYALSVLTNGYEGALLETLGMWNKGDAPHYMGIANNGYVAVGDPRFHIVFLPFYPILVAIFNTLVQNTYVSGLFVSVMCTVIAGILLYELALMDMDTVAAKRAVKFQMLLPAAFLLNAPMSDGLFLLLTILCMLLARKKRFVLACMVGALASFTRLQGVLMILPVCIELVGEARRQSVAGKNAKRLIPSFFALLIIPVGALMYLFVNWNVTGNPLQFLTYQREHWYQQMGWFFNTASYQTHYFLTQFKSDIATAYGLWLPNILTVLFTPAFMLYAVTKKQPKEELAVYEEEAPDFLPDFRRTYRDRIGIDRITKRVYPIRASYIAYFLAYYFVSVGPTWLLSAPRYMLCCFPLSIALAATMRKRSEITLCYIVLLIAQLLYMRAYVMGWPVY
ncbi:hypothetical protein LJC07_08105 [Christensenellaceae bacterium OttesenSCG-928-L17]|nr:hypothetical protein [Christensenellaceae bacterium OttesenSCG-928-L17]